MTYLYSKSHQAPSLTYLGINKEKTSYSWKTLIAQQLLIFPQVLIFPCSVVFHKEFHLPGSLAL